MVNGRCYTGALEIALSCAFVVASERARFADTHATVGLIPEWGMSALLPAAVGTRLARKMMTTGEPIDVERALHERAEQIAARIAAAHGGAVDAVLDLLHRGEGEPLPHALPRGRGEPPLADRRRRGRPPLRRAATQGPGRHGASRAGRCRPTRRCHPPYTTAAGARQWRASGSWTESGEPAAYFRREFTLDEAPRRATLHVTAIGLVELALVAQAAVRIHGGYGFSTEIDVKRYFRDAR